MLYNSKGRRTKLFKRLLLALSGLSLICQAAFALPTDDFLQGYKTRNWIQIEASLKAGATCEIRRLHARTPLLQAAASGDLQLLRLLHSQGCDLKVRTQDLHSALSLAIESGSLELVEYLIQEGFDPKAPLFDDGYTPIMQAALHGHLDLVRYFHQLGGSFEDKVAYENQSVLSLAASSGNQQLVEYLLRQGLSLAHYQKQPIPLLQMAVASGNLQLVKYLLGKGLRFERQAPFAEQYLRSAAYSGNLQLFKYLLSQGLDYQPKSALGPHLIYEAIYSGKPEILQWLLASEGSLKTSADHESILAAAIRSKSLSMLKLVYETMRRQGRGLSSPEYLEAAINSGQLQMLEFLLSQGLNPETLVTGDYSPLAIASMAGLPEAVELLLSRSAKVNSAQFEQSPLRIAIENRDPEITRSLLKAGAKLEQATESGINALWEAISVKSPDLVEILLQAGANPNARLAEPNTQDDEDAPGIWSLGLAEYYDRWRQRWEQGQYTFLPELNRSTPLLWAMFLGQDRLVEQLSAAGADWKMQDARKFSSLHLASVLGRPDWIERALRAGIGVNSLNREKESALMLAVRFEQFEAARFLLQAGADPNLLDFEGSSALFRAIYWQEPAMVKALLEAGATPLLKDQQGKTVLDFAKETYKDLSPNQKEILRLLSQAAGSQ